MNDELKVKNDEFSSSIDSHNDSSLISARRRMMPQILIADDQVDVLEALRMLLKGEGYQTQVVSSPGAVLDALRNRTFDLILIDLNYARDTTSGDEGLDLVSRIKELDGTLPVVAMTAWGTVHLAVEAMHRGVADFVQKPWENMQLLEILRAQLENGRSLRAKVRRDAEKQQEFDEAREIQKGLLPKQGLTIPGCVVSAAWQPARIVSGDYFDVLNVGENRHAVCIGDVSGKGIPAALLMSNLQAAVKAFGTEARAPNVLCDKVNRVISGNIGPAKFITFFYGLYDSRQKRLVYTNAGHCAPILIHRDGSFLRLRTGGAVLGVFSDAQFEETEIELTKGDVLVLFTDGVTEARNSGGEEFGEARLIKLLLENREEGAVQIQERLMRYVVEFTSGNLQDDATMIVVSVQ